MNFTPRSDSQLVLSARKFCWLLVLFTVCSGWWASPSAVNADEREKAAKTAPQQQQQERPPNVVFILIDDMGWTDVGCFGSTYYETPNIDRLATGGMKFTNAYAACQVCSPTRASILTGKYPARLHLTNFLVGNRKKKNSPVLPAPYVHQLHLEEVTLAEALQPAGFTSAHMGKWHLGGTPYLPENQGFALNVAGTHHGMPRSFFYPKWKQNVPLDGKDGDYLADRITDEALKFLEAQQKAPFFLYLPYYEVHIPMEAKPELVEKYKAKEPSATHNNPIYAGMVDSVDQNVGRVMDKLDELKLTDNTIVIFFSDNGGLVTPEGPHTPATSNAPLRMGKGYMYEGGIREPLIVRWPNKVKAGTVCETPVTSVDFFPTLLEAAGLKLQVKDLDGVSLMPLLTGSGELKERDLYWHYPHFSNQGGDPASAIRAGDFKLIEWLEDGRLELFNLTDDISETKDLSHEMPELTEKLHQKLIAWRKSVDATMPPPNPNYQPEDAKPQAEDQ